MKVPKPSGPWSVEFILLQSQELSTKLKLLAAFLIWTWECNQDSDTRSMRLSYYYFCLIFASYHIISIIIIFAQSAPWTSLIQYTPTLTGLMLNAYSCAALDSVRKQFFPAPSGECYSFVKSCFYENCWQCACRLCKVVGTWILQRNVADEIFSNVTTIRLSTSVVKLVQIGSASM